MSDRESMLRTCAFCPNPCRRAIPASFEHQLESRTPSALALLALQTLEARVPRDPSIREALLELDAAIACRDACVYGFDIPAAVRSVAEELPQ
jgi:hypothetical protein